MTRCGCSLEMHQLEQRPTEERGRVFFSWGTLQLDRLAEFSGNSPGNDLIQSATVPAGNGFPVEGCVAVGVLAY